MRFAKRMSTLRPSPTLALNAIARQLVQQGQTVYNFAVGEPDYPTPGPILEAGIESLRKGETRYGPAGGSSDLREAIAAKFQRDNQVSVDPANIVAGMGAKEILFHLFLSLVDEGDEVLVPVPYWVSYPEQIRLAGGVPIIAGGAPSPGRHLTRLDIDAFERLRTPRTVGMVLSTPNNPAGFVLSDMELNTLARWLRRNTLWIIVDEIYEYMTFDRPHLSLLKVAPDLANRIIVVNGLSKAFAMTGWRVGYAAGPGPLMKHLAALQSQSSTCIPRFIERAATKALSLGVTAVAQDLVNLRARRDSCVEILRSLDGARLAPPEGAFYAFVDIRERLSALGRDPERDTSDFCRLLLSDHQVAVAPGDVFGAPGFLRISYATDAKTLATGMDRLRRALEGP